MDLNKTIIQKAANFQARLASKTEAERSLFHYNTTLAVTNKIILFNDNKAVILKNKLVDFFDEVESLDFEIKNRHSSANLHEYLLPITQFLISKGKFITSADLHLLTIIGAISDLVILYLLDNYYPIFIISFFILGIYRKIKAKREGRYAAMFW
jgi:hypothetical protein